MKIYDTGNCWSPQCKDGFDFVVIGGGSAGYAGGCPWGAIRVKNRLHRRRETSGRTCILRGCMPSKTFIESANRFLTLRHAKEFGLSAGHMAFDAEAIVERKQNFVTNFGGTEENN